MMYRALVAICAASAILVGCGNAGNIAGTWSDSSRGETLVFGTDGTYSRLSQKGEKIMTVTGKYTFHGSSLEMTPTGVDLNKDYDPKLSDKIKSQMAPGFNKPIKAQVDFTTPDRVDISQGLMTETLDRKK